MHDGAAPPAIDPASARPEAVTDGVSCLRTCDVGLSLRCGRPYRHIACLLERCSRQQR